MLQPEDALIRIFNLSKANINPVCANTPRPPPELRTTPILVVLFDAEFPRSLGRVLTTRYNAQMP